MDKNEILIRDYFKAINEQDYHKIQTLIHPNYMPKSRGLITFNKAISLTKTENHKNTSSEGAKSLINRLKTFFDGFSDFRLNIIKLNSHNNEVWLDFDIEGIHTGKLFGISPTKRKIKYRGISIYDIKDGKILMSDMLFDWFSLFHQLQDYLTEENDIIVAEEYLSTLLELGIFVEKNSIGGN